MKLVGNNSQFTFLEFFKSKTLKNKTQFSTFLTFSTLLKRYKCLMWVVKSDNCWKDGAGGILNWEIPASRCLHSHEYTKLRGLQTNQFQTW